MVDENNKQGVAKIPLVNQIKNKIKRTFLRDVRRFNGKTIATYLG